MQLSVGEGVAVVESEFSGILRGLRAMFSDWDGLRLTNTINIVAHTLCLNINVESTKSYKSG